MNRSRFAAFTLLALLAVTGIVLAQEALVVDSVDPAEGALECDGDGLIYILPEACLHDGGRSASGDSLEVYCYHGTTRFCLSGEECPWRGSPAGVIDETCSRAGLADEWMATASCEGWSGFHDFECSKQGQIKLRKEGRADVPQYCGGPD